MFLSMDIKNNSLSEDESIWIVWWQTDKLYYSKKDYIKCTQNIQIQKRN